MEEYDEGTVCTVTGWGTTTEGGSLARVLQKVDVPVVSDEHCRDSYGQSDITDSMICAGLDQGGKDSCQGDSGGPFMCGNQLSGVVSWGYGCARELFTRFGIEFSFVDFRDPEIVKAAIRPNTKLVFSESPANPTCTLTDRGHQQNRK